MSQIRLSSDGAALVDINCHWREISTEPPPPNVKLQLINKNLGSATYGYYYEKENNQFTHYAGLPVFPG